MIIQDFLNEGSGNYRIEGRIIGFLFAIVLCFVFIMLMLVFFG
jgi:tetrahydromethanopterin S-methyltransferase subunit F